MKNNSNSVKTQENITRKEWRRNKRKAASLRKKEGKAAAAKKRAEEPKRYDLLAQYNNLLSQQVRTILEEKKIKYTILTDGYFVISNLAESACKEIETAFKDCKLSRGESRKPMIVKFAKWKSKTIIHDNAKESKPTNNTTEAKRAARAKRKAKNIQNFKTRLTKAEKIALGRGRSKKKTEYRAKKNNGNKVTPGLNESTTEKKIRMRARKAFKYIIRKEKKTILPKKTLYTKKKKAVQQKFNFAA